MVSRATRNPSYCGSQKAKAKSLKTRVVTQLVRFDCKEGHTHGGWHDVSKQARRRCALHLAEFPRNFARVVDADV